MSGREGTARRTSRCLGRIPPPEDKKEGEEQAPRDNQNVQSPRANQDLQSPGRYHASRGGSIRSGQEALKAKGFDPGEIDGRYGPKTQAAITEYQRTNGLRETGRFDQATLGQLGVGSERADTTGSPSRRN